jgi:drug/metabolite transporter (DMT)-like permease
MSIRALPFVLLQGLLFGTSLVASRFSVGQFHPTTYVGLRLMLASLCHIGIYVLDHRRRLPKSLLLWWRALPMGIVGTAVPMVAIVTSTQYQSAGLTGLLLTTGPAFTVLLAHFVLDDEALTWRKAAGVILALSGAAVLGIMGESGLPDIRGANPLGYGLACLGILASSVMAVYARKALQGFDTFDVASIRMFSATLTVLPLSAILTGIDLAQVNSQGYFVLGYGALAGTFVGFLISLYNIREFGATAASLPQYVIPIVSGLGGALFLREKITPGMVGGMILIVAGLVLINRTETRSEQNADSAA